MAKIGRDPVGSMGNDAPLAVLSNKPQLLYNYFKQLFAQVTNPPLDPLKEETITSADSTIGPERNLLNPEPESCRQIYLKTPILTNEELEMLRRVDRPGLKATTIPMLFDVADGESGLEKAMDRLFAAAEKAIQEEHTILILSDRGVDQHHAPIPALLAMAGLHHHLIRKGARTKVGITFVC
jgi:glutamate synthase (ferredoxin)